MPFSGRHLAGKQSKTTFAINAATTYFCHFEVRIAKSYLWYVRAQLNTLKEETLIHLFIFLIRSICLFVCFCFCFFFSFFTFDCQPIIEENANFQQKCSAEGR